MRARTSVSAVTIDDLKVATHGDHAYLEVNDDHHHVRLWLGGEPREQFDTMLELARRLQEEAHFGIAALYTDPAAEIAAALDTTEAAS